MEELNNLKVSEENQVVSLSKAVSEILSSENRSLSLGEASDKLNSYIVKIKDLVDTGDITLDELSEEIVKHIKDKEEVVPNSLAQLLIGCVGDKNSCLMKAEKPEDVPFLYNHQGNNLQPLSKNNNPLTEDSVAVVYFSGNPEKISIESLKFLEDQGFHKLRIEYKDVNSANYKVINVDNLKKYIYSKPEQDIYRSVMILGFILLLIFALHKMQ
jgi:hypothetical protein